MVILKGLPGGYQRDLQETKEPFFDGIGITRDALRAVALVMSNVEVDAKALERGFSPGVFATDRALELVADGVPFRDAYNDVKANLDKLGDYDPKTAVAAKVHEGASGGLDFKAMRRRSAEGLRFAKINRKRYYATISKLLGVEWSGVEREKL